MKYTRSFTTLGALQAYIHKIYQTADLGERLQAYWEEKAEVARFWQISTRRDWVRMNKFAGFPIFMFVVSSFSLHLQQEKTFPLCVYLFRLPLGYVHFKTTSSWKKYSSLALVSSFNILLQKCISVDLSCICIFGNLYLRWSWLFLLATYWWVRSPGWLVGRGDVRVQHIFLIIIVQAWCTLTMTYEQFPYFFL